MSASREGFDLFGKTGRYCFIRNFKSGTIPWKYVFEDTFVQIWCWIVGHNKYECADCGDMPEYACLRCHHYVKPPWK